jgi:hypothetical protein
MKNTLLRAAVLACMGSWAAAQDDVAPRFAVQYRHFANYATTQCNASLDLASHQRGASPDLATFIKSFVKRLLIRIDESHLISGCLFLLRPPGKGQRLGIGEHLFPGQ